MRTRGTGRQRGLVMVEYAIVAPLAVFLLFGILEFGLYMKDYLGLQQAAREGARVAIVGSSPTAIVDRARASALTLDTAQVAVPTMQWREYFPATSTWGAWTTLGVRSDGITNTAAPRSQIRVTCTYPHQLVLPQMFGAILKAQNGVCTLQATKIMRRE